MPFLKWCNPQNSSSNDKLGIALLGLGYYSTDLLAPALQLTQHCELRGIITGSPNKIPTWQGKYGIPDANVYSYDTMHEIANNDQIDIIYIVVPTALHKKYSVLAAESGKHVWCEKPMAMNVVDCQSIIDACNKNGVKLSIGYRMRHEPNTKTVMGYTATKPYGNINHIDSQAGYAGGGGGTGWRFQRNMGGGAMYDMGVYTVNGIRYASNREPVEVIKANQYRDKPDLFNDVDYTSEYWLRFDDDVEAYGKTSVYENVNHLKITCENGWYQLSPMQTYNGVQGTTSDGKSLDIFVENQQAIQMDQDALAIMNNTPFVSPGIEGLKDIKIIEAIIKSAESGQSVMI
jgi:glucose-fructose oxidoreductase